MTLKLQNNLHMSEDTLEEEMQLDLTKFTKQQMFPQLVHNVKNVNRCALLIYSVQFSNAYPHLIQNQTRGKN